MAKKFYSVPILFGENGSGVTGGSGTIYIGGSQQTKGEDEIYKFDSAIDSSDIWHLENDCDDTDYAAMDTDNNLTISKAEFDKWFAEVMGGNW